MEKTKETPIDPDVLQSSLKSILNAVKSQASAWPFQKPVEKSEAPDYYDHIKYPMGMYVLTVYA